MKTVWDKLAIRTLRRIVEYIQIDSEEAAKKVYDTIVSQTRTLYLFPNKFAIEPHLSTKEKTYRFITVWSYKIIYRVGENDIRIVDVFHTRRNPDTMLDER